MPGFCIRPSLREIRKTLAGSGSHPLRAGGSRRGYLVRAIGVSLCLLGTSLTSKERLFCIIAYLPKATVQAAIGSVPMAMGLSCGPIVLSVAVLAILITAPLGATGMERSYQKLLKKA